MSESDLPTRADRSSDRTDPTRDMKLETEARDLDRTRAVENAGVSAAGRPEIPEQIGPYRITGVIGEGGMGMVYAAVQDNPRRDVALKVIRPGLATRDHLRRFELEAQMLARLQHPGIAQVYEAGTAETGGAVTPYFAMELVKGESLNEFADSRSLGTRERLALMMRICDAVEHAHQKGVIHRDLKPANILVSALDSSQTSAGSTTTTGGRNAVAGMRPIILDFGVARAADGDIQATTAHTDVGQIIGTLPYMSPEQVAADPLELDTRSDVYALGVILYELLSGHPPYVLQGKMLHEAVRVIREDEPTRLSRHHRALRGDVETLVAKALAKEKDRRYQSAAELGADIRRYLNHEPIAARPPSTSYQLKKFARRNRELVAGLAAVFVVLVAGVVVSTSQAVRATRAEREAEGNLAKASAVNSFLTDMLGSVMPEEALGREVTVREVLDEAAAGIEHGSFAEQPEIEGAVRVTLANSYIALGHYDRGEDLQLAALELHRQLYGETNETVATDLRNLADLAYRVGDYGSSRDYIDQAMAAVAELHGEHSLPMADCMRIHGLLSYNGANYADALEIHQQALAIRRDLDDPQSRSMARTLEDIAFLLNEQRRYNEAELLITEALGIYLELYGEEHPTVVGARNDLGLILEAKGDLTGAEAVLTENLAMSRRLYGDDHVATANTLWRLGHIMASTGKHQEAEGLQREGLAVRRKLLGNEHRDVATSLSSLARILAHSGRWDEAEALYLEGLEIRRSVFGADHVAVAASLNALGYFEKSRGDYQAAVDYHLAAQEILRQSADHRADLAGSLTHLALAYQSMGDFDRAEAAFRGNLEIARELSDGESREVARGINNLASLLFRKGEREQAQAMLVEALDIRRRVLARGHPETMESLGNVGFLAEARGAYAEAEPYYREYVELCREFRPENDSQTQGALALLGANLVKQERWTAAEPVLRECLASREATLSPDDWRIANTQSLLGAALAGQEHYAEAEPFLLQGYEGLKDNEQRASFCRQALQRVVDLYVAWDKPQDVESWQLRLASLEQK